MKFSTNHFEILIAWISIGFIILSFIVQILQLTDEQKRNKPSYKIATLVFLSIATVLSILQFYFQKSESDKLNADILSIRNYDSLIKRQSDTILSTNNQLKEDNVILKAKIDSINTHRIEYEALSPFYKKIVIDNLIKLKLKHKSNSPLIEFYSTVNEQTVYTKIKTDIIALINESKSKLMAQCIGGTSLLTSDYNVPLTSCIYISTHIDNLIFAEDFVKSLKPYIKADFHFDKLNKDSNTVKVYFFGNPIFDRNGCITIQ